MAWLRLQRFIFGGQLSTFDDLETLGAAVQRVFQEEARLAIETPPPSMSAKQAEALAALRELGYPFEVPAARENSTVSHSARGGRGERIELLASVRELANAAMPGTEVLPVGSFAWGVDTDGSDLDVVVLPPALPQHLEGHPEHTGQAILDLILSTLKRLQAEGSAPHGLQDAEWAHYGQTSVPVLTLRAEVNGQLMGIDICAFGQLGSVRDAILFRHALAVNPDLCTVLQLLKRWLRARAMPSCREGGFPQIFWMRLAARNYQQIRNAGSNTTDIAQDEASMTASTSEEEAREDEARQHLRRLCVRWSIALPAWGEPLNLQGEDPCGAAKRLATGVFGATALLCIRELRSLAAAPRIEDLSSVAPQKHLVPVRAGFWAAFLLPRPEADGAKGLPAEVVAAWIGHSWGEAESVRHSAFIKEGLGCNAMLQPPGCPAALADARLACEHRYVSRRDTEWVLWAETANEAAIASDAEENPVSSSAAVHRHLALAPPHFVCLLEGDPAHSQEAKEELLQLQAIVAEPPVAASLPPAYPLHRYSRKLLLRTRPTVGKKELSAAAKWGLQKR